MALRSVHRAWCKWMEPMIGDCITWVWGRIARLQLGWLIQRSRFFRNSRSVMLFSCKVRSHVVSGNVNAEEFWPFLGCSVLLSQNFVVRLKTIISVNPALHQ
uniref:Uncharacterized protein n=1 Tax=Arundo donax TaxID=35708 RepID=A0A0A8YN58_ARUDO